MSSDVGTPITTSHVPILRVLRRNPRRWDHHVYSTRASRSPDTIAPGQPPTPESTAMYCLPPGPRYVTGCAMIPEPVRNCHNTLPLRASTALNQPSIVP